MVAPGERPALTADEATWYCETARRGKEAMISTHCK